MYEFTITPQIARDLAWLEAAYLRLSRTGVSPRRWTGRLRRELQAGAIAASSWMEGVDIDADQTRRILAGDRPATVAASDVALVEGYRDAVSHGVVEVTRPGFVWSSGLVLDVHRIAMGASERAGAGRFRSGPVFVVGTAGDIIYTAPPAPVVPGLVDECCAWLNEHPNLAAPVAAAVIHAVVAGIHPFSDGNGRTARILAMLAMVRGGFTIPEFTSLEEWWGTHLRNYYGSFACLGPAWSPDANVTRFMATHVRAQRRQVTALAGRLAVERHVWTALEDIVVEDVGLPARATEATFDAFLGRAITNRYYRGTTSVSVATATNDLRALELAGLLDAVGEGRSREYVGTFRLLALVASAAGAPVLASSEASLTEQRAVILDDLLEQLR